MARVRIVIVGGGPGGYEAALVAAQHDADVVLVATGSSPRLPPFSRPDGQRVFTSRELFDLRACRNGSWWSARAPTGAEYAHAFARFGSEVHLISSRDQVLPGEDPDAAK